MFDKIDIHLLISAFPLFYVFALAIFRLSTYEITFFRDKYFSRHQWKTLLIHLSASISLLAVGYGVFRRQNQGAFFLSSIFQEQLLVDFMSLVSCLIMRKDIVVGPLPGHEGDFVKGEDGWIVITGGNSGIGFEVLSR